MKRLTAKNNDDGVVLLGSPSVIELAERLYEFEHTFDDDTIADIKELRNHCDIMAVIYGDAWKKWLDVMDRLLKLIVD